MNWKKIATYVGIGLLGIILIMVIMGFINSEFWPMNICLMLGIELVLVGIMIFILILGSHRTSNEQWVIASAITVLWLLIAFFYYRGEFKAQAGNVASQSTEDVIKITSELENANAQWANALDERDKAQSELSTASAQIDALQKALNKCKGIKEPLTPEEEIAKLKREVAALKNAPRTRTTEKNFSPPADVVETQFTANEFSTTGSTGSYKKTTDAAADVHGGAKVSYAGQIPAGSKVGITVTADRFRLYYLIDSYVSENGMTIPAPRLNGTNGPEFTLDAASGYWYYLDNSTLLSPMMVNNWDYTNIWCVYIGRIGTWDAYLPHESMKALMKSVRGREDGEVTMQELYKMNASNSDIWTDQNKTGSIMPKSFNPISGEKDKGTVRGPEDGLIYQGWDFRCRTTGTVTTEKINGSSSSSNTTTRN